MYYIMRGIFAKVPIIAAMLSSLALARPIWILSLESDGGLYVGGEYQSVGVKFSILPTMSEIAYDKFDHSMFLSLSKSNEHFSSVTKTFGHDGYNTGIEWRFGYAELESESSDGTKTSGKEFSNAFGYYVSKQFGKIEIQLGSYVLADYRHDYCHEYMVDSDTGYIVHKNELDLSPELLFGMSLRL